MKFHLPVVTFLSLLLGGCAVGNRYGYDSIVADTSFSGTGAVAVATHDQRPYVLNGDKDPQFVGLQRGGFGNTFDVRTTGDRPMADDMTAAIVNTLKRKGFNASAVTVAHTASAEAARTQLLAAHAPRSVLLTVRDWKSDSMMRLGLDYDMSLAVLDGEGKVLAETKQRAQKEVLGAAPMIPSDAGPMVGNAFKAKLELMFADPAIVRAMGSK
jgi:hypothetical protein